MAITTTEFIFFYDVPLYKFNETIHFKNNADRDAHFLEKGFYNTAPIQDKEFNFMRQRNRIQTGLTYDECAGINYCTYKKHGEDMRYYAHVVECNYMSDGCAEFTLVTDVLMTYTQGQVLTFIDSVSIIREHLNDSEYAKYLPVLRNNEDILKTYSKRYTYNAFYPMDSFYVIFQCTCDLSQPFGDKTDPDWDTASGDNYDKMTSPVNLYLVEYEDFNDLMKTLAPYPWIGEQITKVLMVPANFIDYDQTVSKTVSAGGFSKLRGFKRNGNSVTDFPLAQLNLDYNELCAIHGLDHLQESHLLRNEYTTIEYYTWDGQQLSIDAGGINDGNGLYLYGLVSAGYHNQFSFYVRNYRADGNEVNTGIPAGSFLNDSLTFNNFDELPVLLDSGTLAMAKKANQIEYNNSKQFSNRAATVFDSGASTEDRVFNAISLSSDLSIAALTGRLTSEYEYYRQQRAEFADLALTPPSVGAQTFGNSFQIANGIYGITLKISSLSSEEWNKVRKYYSQFGFDMEGVRKRPSDVECMSVCNFLQFEGNWNIPGADLAHMEQLRALLAEGVTLWHDNNTADPTAQDLLLNRRIR